MRKVFCLIGLLVLGCTASVEPLTGADAIEDCWDMLPEGAGPFDNFDGDLGCEIFYCIQRAVDPDNVVEYNQYESTCLDRVSDGRYRSSRNAITTVTCVSDIRHGDEEAWRHLCL